MENESKFDLNKEGILDERELQLVMEKEAKKSRFNLLSTHPSTYKRLLLLKRIEEEISLGNYTPENIYKYI